jgi:glycosyltransferase involved in cell wall biosynthesis
MDVRFLANLSTELVDLYDACELFVSLSWRESFGLPMLEAMSRGARVVASAWGATPEVLGECGRMVDPRDANRAAAVVLDVLEEPPAARAAASECGRRRAEQFTWQETTRETMEVYEQLLQRRVAR